MGSHSYYGVTTIKETMEKELKEIKSHADIIDISKKSNELWVVYQDKDSKKVYLEHVLFRKDDDGEIMCKPVDECDGPVSDTCPKRIVKLMEKLSPDCNEYAQQFRNRIMGRIAQ